VSEPIRVVVIDDSALGRQTITQMLESDPEIHVVGRAPDGDEGLRQVFQHHPDLVTVDLEMPRMDGFTFLRILMGRHPTPALVISSYAARENVFRALELGALDFIAKPGPKLTPDLRAIRDQLLVKVKLVRQLRRANLNARAQAAAQRVTPVHGAVAVRPAGATGVPGASAYAATVPPAAAPLRVIAIGASTGGPPALQQLLQGLEPSLPAAIVITQHMPAKFTHAFAERLARATAFAVKEAEEGDVLRPGLVLVAPGAGSLSLSRQGARLLAHVETAGSQAQTQTQAQTQAQERFVPSIDRMLTSVAEVCGPNALAVVLTGMGGDASRGVRAIKAARGQVIVEGPESAVIFGMPQEAIQTGAVDEVLPLPRIVDAITRFAHRPR